VWTCEIGPIPRDRVPDGGDLPLRLAVKEAFRQMFGEDAEFCASGWGRNKEGE